MPYKIGLGTHALAALALVTILPESLSAGSFAKEAASAREEERAREAERQEREEAADSSSSQSGLRKSVAARMFTAARRLMAPLESLSTFLPRKVHADPVRKDWNLFLLAVTNFILTILSVRVIVQCEHALILGHSRSGSSVRALHVWMGLGTTWPVLLSSGRLSVHGANGGCSL